MSGAAPRVGRNDWSSLEVPGIDATPALTVSVVIPAYGRQAELDLALCALANQTYPAELTEVVVVDDGSDPPLRLPTRRPARTTLVRVQDGWGKSNALREGVAHATGELVLLLDADMVVYPEHVAAHARWHHVLPYAVTLGHKRFVDGPLPSAAAVAQAWTQGRAADLFGGDPGQPHEYQERYISQTDQLRTADHLVFRIFVGATVGLRRKMYDLSGGPDPQLRFGGDTEFGYRLSQAGAVFIPEPRARAWHLGETHVMRAHDEIARYRLAFLTDRVPYPRHWRKVGGTAWTVPLAEVVMEVADQPMEHIRAAVDSVLRGTEPDVQVILVGPWDRLDPGRVPALTDPQLEPRLIAATYRGEPRVRLATEAPASAFPTPYRLELPPACGLAPAALANLVDLADRYGAGVVQVEVPGGQPAALWRTAALGRAGWVREPGESLIDAVASVSGRRDVPAADIGVGDSARTGRRQRLVPTAVEVEGVRSLARAAAVVGWLAGRRAFAWVRGISGRRSSWQTGPPAAPADHAQDGP